MQPVLMQATSRESLARLRQRADDAVARLDAAAAATLSDELFAVAGLLQQESTLRRTLSDYSSEPQARRDLVNNLLGQRVGTVALELVSDAVEMKWSVSGDLTDALIDSGRQAAFASAETAGTLDTVEEELFRFGRILEANGQLRTLLSDVTARADRKVELLDRLVDDRATPVTVSLLRQAVRTPRVRHVDSAVEELTELAARRRRRSVAEVRSARPLSVEQENRLGETLSRIYGRPIAITVDVDPKVLGGLRVTVGDEVIDGTVAHRLDEVRRRLAG